MELIKKFFNQMKTRGTGETLLKAVVYPITLVNRRRFLSRISNRGTSEVFTEIHRNEHWGSGESVSGVGSSLAQTENLRAHLPLIFEKFGIATVLDAPCGDMHWMQAVPLTEGMTYIGGDIVEELIRVNKERYADKTHTFVKLDITTNSLPKADLMICRDCLFHLSYRDTLLFLENFSISEIPFLLTTTHKDTNNFDNSDILTGDFRKIDLFQRPYKLSCEVLYRLDDYLAPEFEREICIWTKEQIVEACKDMALFLSRNELEVKS